jgi:hypothetical protein
MARPGVQRAVMKESTAHRNAALLRSRSYIGLLPVMWVSHLGVLEPHVFVLWCCSVLLAVGVLKVLAGLGVFVVWWSAITNDRRSAIVDRSPPVSV